ncbi:glycerophosphodiester phosphodiesterase [Bacillus benzoevorans]|uniref:Glycerophosphoryl diester phosphodiesterase n=1 Tax=Bacillus benzoevorans TaxID=1456 RepID=A0A7X0HQ31_9BACI|nr:glycerophosphodiester phosphodiesterase [Bacillus benzoevorans]MBB6444862.1 glycerophosphoryl diester phosphodiesterase [Bacillus benzoevorans]
MTLVFAHRGFSALYPENTMIAFKKAGDAGADGIELDVQLTKEGEVVVIHDEKVNRTTDGSGYVKDLTYSEIKSLNAGMNRKSEVPSLREVLQWLTENQLICNIELKNNVFAYAGMEEKVIKLIREYGLSHRIILSSFNHNSLVLCRRLAPEIETAALLSQQIYQPWVYAASIGVQGIHPKYVHLSDDTLQQSLANGVAVRPYTVNKGKHMRRLFHYGCTAFITDDPAYAVSLRRNLNNPHFGV